MDGTREKERESNPAKNQREEVEEKDTNRHLPRQRPLSGCFPSNVDEQPSLSLPTKTKTNGAKREPTQGTTPLVSSMA